MTGKLINNWNLHHKLFQPPLIIRTVSVIVWLRRGKRLLQPPEKWTCSVMKWEFVKAWEATGKNTYNSHWITSVGRRNSKSHLATVHLYFYKWQKRLLKDSKLAEFHLHSFHISSVRLSAPATGALRRAARLFSRSSNSNLISGTLILPSLSVNMHISPCDMLRTVRLTVNSAYRWPTRWAWWNIKSTYALLPGVPTVKRNLFTMSPHHISWSSRDLCDSTE